MIALGEPAKLNSCVYEGSVFHHRLGPTPHRFRKRLYMVYLDLDELDQVFDRRMLWSTKRTAFARFDRADHVGEPNQSLRETVGELLQQAGYSEKPESIGLLTQLRNFGFVFNPLSLFYCHDRNGELSQVVAEVSNTPWFERHCYVLNPEVDGTDDSSDSRVAKFDKEFHVSPFMPMDMQYSWRFNQPAEKLTVQIENWRHGSKQFEVGMKLNRLPITASNLAWMLVKYPLMPQQTVASIYWQALRLWLKRTPFFSHPRKLVKEESAISESLGARD